MIIYKIIIIFYKIILIFYEIIIIICRALPPLLRPEMIRKSALEIPNVLLYFQWAR